MLRPWALALCGVVFAIAVCSATGKRFPCPEIEATGQGARLQMTPAILRAVQAAAPGFRPLTLADFSEGVRQSYRYTTAQAPWAVIGDFDGDGFCDLVVDGRSGSESYRLCVWGSPSGPRVMTLGRRRLKAPASGLTVALALIPRSEVDLWARKQPGDSFGDGFGERVSGKLPRVYYWRDGRFVRLEAK